MLFIYFAPLKRKVQEYQAQRKGEVVEVVEVHLTKLRPTIGCKVLNFFDFKYAGNQYSKKAGCNFHDSHMPGQVIKLKHLSEMDIFLFPDEDLVREFIAYGLLGVFGLFLLIKAAIRPA